MTRRSKRTKPLIDEQGCEEAKGFIRRYLADRKLFKRRMDENFHRFLINLPKCKKPPDQPWRDFAGEALRSFDHKVQWARRRDEDQAAWVLVGMLQDCGMSVGDAKREVVNALSLASVAALNQQLKRFERDTAAIAKAVSNSEDDFLDDEDGLPTFPDPVVDLRAMRQQEDRVLREQAAKLGISLEELRLRRKPKKEIWQKGVQRYFLGEELTFDELMSWARFGRDDGDGH